MLPVEIGEDLYIAPGELVAILDMRTLPPGSAESGLLGEAHHLGGVPRSLVVTDRGHYLTPVVPATLASRFGFRPRRRG